MLTPFVYTHSRKQLGYLRPLFICQIARVALTLFLIIFMSPIISFFIRL